MRPFLAALLSATASAATGASAATLLSRLEVHDGATTDAAAAIQRIEQRVARHVRAYEAHRERARAELDRAAAALADDEARLAALRAAEEGLRRARAEQASLVSRLADAHAATEAATAQAAEVEARILRESRDEAARAELTAADSPAAADAAARLGAARALVEDLLQKESAAAKRTVEARESHRRELLRRSDALIRTQKAAAAAGASVMAVEAEANRLESGWAVVASLDAEISQAKAATLQALEGVIAFQSEGRKALLEAERSLALAQQAAAEAEARGEQCAAQVEKAKSLKKKQERRCQMRAVLLKGSNVPHS